MESSSCQELINEVVKKDLCTLCGACLGMCPYLVAHNGRIVLKDLCALSKGRCSIFCPRISLDLDKLSKTIFEIPYSWDGLGPIKAIFMARSTNKEVKKIAQDAGMVTTLFCFARNEGIIDSAVMTLFEDKSLPRGVIVSTRAEVLACAGSSYMAAPIVETFNRGAQDVGRKRIGFAGTPCQVLSLARMKESTLEERNDIGKLELVIGLFCTWALSYPDFSKFLEREVSDRIIKYDIPPHPANVLQIYTEKDRIDIHLERIMSFIRPSCHVCHDLTAEFADISVGSGRGEVSEWNSIIVRSERGMKILEAAKRKGVIEVTDIPEKNLSRLQDASLNKKRSAFKNILQKTGSLDDLLYLKLQPHTVKQLLAE